MDSGIEHGSRYLFIMPERTVSIILSRLPVKSLLRFKCVCRSWCALISEPYFINFQLNQAKQNPVFLIVPFKEEVHFYTYKEGGQRCNFLMKWQHPSDGPLCMYPFTCDGLVLFYSDTKIHVCNPSTTGFTTLPEGTPTNSLTKRSPRHIGFGFDATTNKYKVVRIFYRSRIRKELYGVGCEIFELGSCAWRAVCAPPQPASAMFPAVMDGVLYWLTQAAYKGKSEDILSFDLGSEKFGVITGPPCTSDPPVKRPMKLLAGPGGNLCLVIRGSSSMDFWMYKPGSKDVAWVKEFSINIEWTTKVFPRCFHHGKVLLRFQRGMYYYTREKESFRPMLVSRNGSKSDDDSPYINMRFLIGAHACPVVHYVESLVPVE